MALKRGAPKYGKHTTNRIKWAVSMNQINDNFDRRWAFKSKVGTGINCKLGRAASGQIERNQACQFCL